MTKRESRRSVANAQPLVFWWQTLAWLVVSRRAEIGLSFTDEERYFAEKFSRELALADSLDALAIGLDRVFAELKSRVQNLQVEAEKTRRFVEDERSRMVLEGREPLDPMGRPWFETYLKKAEVADAFVSNMRGEAFEKYSTSLVRVIVLACETGNLTVLRHLADEAGSKGKRRWVETCERHRKQAGTVYDPDCEWLPLWLAELPKLLAEADERANDLSSEQVRAAWAAGRPERLSARLAAACNAFGYRSEDDAWDLFRKYVNGGNRHPD